MLRKGYLFLAVLVLTTVSGFSVVTDKSKLTGTWDVVQAIYSSGEKTTKIKMAIVFDATMISTPMTQKAVYTINESAKTIKFVNGPTNFTIGYALSSGTTMTWTLMSYTLNGSTKFIVGSGSDAIMRSMDLKKR